MLPGFSMRAISIPRSGPTKAIRQIPQPPQNMKIPEWMSLFLFGITLDIAAKEKKYFIVSVDSNK